MKYCVVLNIKQCPTGMIMNYLSNRITNVFNKYEKTKYFVTIYILKTFKIHVAVLRNLQFSYMFLKH